MRSYLLKHICCPNCRGDVETSGIPEPGPAEIIDGSLICRGCNSTFPISEGIPILLPRQFSNAAECKIRKEVSENAAGMIDRWQSLYDVHHFRQLAHLRIKEQLSETNTAAGRPKVLDIGISWGVNYLPFAHDIELWGLDISHEALLLLKRLYEKEGAPTPNLICASLSSIPIKDVKFNLIWSTQTYQHIPDMQEISSSISYLINELHHKEGTFVIDSLNYNCERILARLKDILRPDKSRKSDKERSGDNFYIKYYLEEDFNSLIRKFGGEVKHEIVFTENLFHPEAKIIPRSRLLARTDMLIQKTPLAKFLGRQITLIIKKSDADIIS